MLWKFNHDLGGFALGDARRFEGGCVLGRACGWVICFGEVGWFGGGCAFGLGLRLGGFAFGGISWVGEVWVWGGAWR